MYPTLDANDQTKLSTRNVYTDIIKKKLLFGKTHIIFCASFKV